MYVRFILIRSYGLGLIRLGLMEQHQLKDSITMCKDSLQELVKRLNSAFIGMRGTCLGPMQSSLLYYLYHPPDLAAVRAISTSLVMTLCLAEIRNHHLLMIGCSNY